MATVTESAPASAVTETFPSADSFCALFAAVDDELAKLYVKYLLNCGKLLLPGHDDLYPEVYVCDVLAERFTRKTVQLGVDLMSGCGFPHTRCSGNYVLVARREVDEAEARSFVREHQRQRG